MPNFEFYNPWFLVLFLLFIPLVLRDLKIKKTKSITVPSIQGMKRSGYYHWVLFFFKISKYFILFGLVVAMARPRTYDIVAEGDGTGGIDIILTVDVSLSMLAKDLNPDRLTSLKAIAKDFVTARQTDRIGLVAYSGEAITKVPVTTDYQVVKDEIDHLTPFELQQGTAIGEGLSVAVSHLRRSKSKTKIIILMTDGVDTIENTIAPETAAKLAKDHNIKVYTIGIGTNGIAEFPVRYDIFDDIIFEEQEVFIDETTLKTIAGITSGRYFRATSNTSLKKVYEEINQMEKTNVKMPKRYRYTEYFRLFLWISLVVFMVDGLMRFGLFRKI